MSYRLRFHELALDEWRRLDRSVRVRLKQKLIERLENPRLPAAALSAVADCYKIKLRSSGHRMIYRVDDEAGFVTVLAIGKRDKMKAYKTAKTRFNR